MKYGPFTEKVQEIMDFIQTEVLLANPAHTLSKPAIIEHDFARALHRAWTQDFEDEGVFTVWKDLRELATSDIDPEFSMPLREKIDLAVSEHISRFVTRRYAEIHDEVFVDIFGCAYNRAVGGPDDNLFERLFSFYREGVWPCGWSGCYPEGTIIVFKPL